MNIVEKAVSLVTGQGAEPVGTVKVVDPNFQNWLYITYNTVEELVRVDSKGNTIPAAMSGYQWRDDRTLEINVRENERFQDGEPLTAHSVKRAFDEMMRWKLPHPPGQSANIKPGTQIEVTGPLQVTLTLPEPDGGTVTKLRGMHLMSSRFWDEVGFGYRKNGSGEGHW